MSLCYPEGQGGFPLSIAQQTEWFVGKMTSLLLPEMLKLPQMFCTNHEWITEQIHSQASTIGTKSSTDIYIYGLQCAVKIKMRSQSTEY